MRESDLQNILLHCLSCMVEVPAMWKGKQGTERLASMKERARETSEKVATKCP